MEKKNVREEDLPVVRLLAGNDWIFGHPMLKLIADTASSPKAADNHICKMLPYSSFRSSVARAMRMAVIARQKLEENCPEPENVWRALATDPSDMEIVHYETPVNMAQLQSFGTTNSNPPYAPLEVLSKLNWFPENGWIDRKSWPFLLREFKIKEHTTFPLDHNDWESVASIEEEDVRMINFDFSKCTESGKIFLSCDNKLAKFYSSSKDVHILATNIVTQQIKNETSLPRFYKVININRCHNKSDSENILIVCPIDRDLFNHKTKGFDGYMIYEKSITLINGLLAKLHLEFKIRCDGLLVDSCNNKPIISICTSNHELSLLGDNFFYLNEDIQIASNKLYSIVALIWGQTDKFSNLHLPNFTGEHILTKPIENLYELFLI